MSFRLLAIDTTSEIGSLALAEGERVMEEVELRSTEGFAHVLFEEIEQLLKRHEMQIADLDGFVSASGPGAFTGVRIGLTAAKGLAEATGKPVVAVSNLRALASFGTRGLRAPVIDARRGEIFGCLYDSQLEAVRDEVVVPFEEWLASLPSGDIEIISNGYRVESDSIPVLSAPPTLAAAIACIAVKEFALGKGLDPAEIDANYVRRSDAEKFWKEPS